MRAAAAVDDLRKALARTEAAAVDFPHDVAHADLVVERFDQLAVADFTPNYACSADALLNINATVHAAIGSGTLDQLRSRVPGADDDPSRQGFCHERMHREQGAQ